MLFVFALGLVSALVASAADFNVAVGANNQLVFDPTSVTVQNGDTIHFQFVSKNHSVTQSTFASPCTRMEGGIDSGFFSVPVPNTHPVWSFRVNDASLPFWFYCAQKNPVNHCQTGMVFAINPTADKPFDAFQTAARNNATSSNGAANGALTETIPVITLSANVPAVTSPGILSSTAIASSGSGFSTSYSTATGTALSSESTPNPNGAIITRDLGSTRAVAVVGLIVAFISFAV